MRVGYAKIGRSWNLDPQNWSAVGGDVDVYRLLHKLATDHPDDTLVLTGRNSGECPQDVGLPPNVENPWTVLRERARPADVNDLMGTVLQLDELTLQMFRDCDQHIVWAGQHGTSNAPIPKVGDRSWAPENLTNPQLSFVNYASYVVRGISAWRSDADGQREEVWLCPDPRNYLKCRDLKWPHRHPVLAQYEQHKQQKHERYGDRREADTLGFRAKWDGDTDVWVCRTAYAYSGLEMTALPPPAEVPFAPTGEHPFGILVNENRREVRNARLGIVKRWVVDQWPDCPMHGQWTDASLETLGRQVDTIPNHEVLHTLSTWRTTLTTPASGSGWATAKPWECFAAGVVCFFHPGYDTQGHIIPTMEQVEKGMRPELAHLARWLRVEDSEQLKRRVDAVCADDATYRWLVEAQREYYEEAYERHLITEMIGKRVGW